MEDDLRLRVEKIAKSAPGEKFIYKLKCKIAFEVGCLKKLFGHSRVNNSAEQILEKTFLGASTYSEALQDIFVISMCKGTGLSSYLEIGAGPAKFNSNSYLLESHFEWEGISIELNEKFVNEFKEIRKNEILLTDATKLDYSNLLKNGNFPKDIGYLQIDINPSYQSLLTLFQIPFGLFRFGVITFEHDQYRTSRKIAKISRLKLEKEGYLLVARNVLSNFGGAFEDWWVHPELIPLENYSHLASQNAKPQDFLQGIS
jgi:hypothetical protein